MCYGTCKQLLFCLLQRLPQLVVHMHQLLPQFFEIHTHQLSHNFETFVVLYVVTKANSTWGLYCYHCNTLNLCQSPPTLICMHWKAFHECLVAWDTPMEARLLSPQSMTPRGLIVADSMWSSLLRILFLSIPEPW